MKTNVRFITGRLPNGGEKPVKIQNDDGSLKYNMLVKMLQEGRVVPTTQTNQILLEMIKERNKIKKKSEAVLDSMFEMVYILADELEMAGVDPKPIFDKFVLEFIPCYERCRGGCSDNNGCCGNGICPKDDELTEDEYVKKFAEQSKRWLQSDKDNGNSDIEKEFYDECRRTYEEICSQHNHECFET